MSGLESLLLGLLQGLTEYLPVSSSGHLEIGKTLLGIDPEQGGLAFDVVLHVATVLATLLVMRREVWGLLKGLFRWRWNNETRYIVNILVSMIPIAIVGLCFEDKIEALYADEATRLTVVGVCLLVTAVLLTLTHFAKPRRRAFIRKRDALAMGVAQAVAVLPGLSRSGSTIATGLLLGCRRETVAGFSFLMVIPPILGEALLDLHHIVSPEAGIAMGTGTGLAGVGAGAMAIGFVAAFVSGAVACKWMLWLVRKAKLVYFGVYCAVAGVLVLCFM